jgi:hypothetical protein
MQVLFQQTRLMELVSACDLSHEEENGNGFGIKKELPL